MVESYDEAYLQKLRAKTDWYTRLDRNRIYVEPVIQALPRGARVLDVATGISDIPLRLVREGFETHAIDAHESLNRTQRPYTCPEATFVEGDARALPYSDRFFNALIVKDFLEHLSDTDTIRFLAEADRVLKPGGILVVGCPVQTPTSRLLRSYNRWTRQDFNGIDDTGDTTHQQWYTERALHAVLFRVSGMHIDDTQYLLYGVNRFPRLLIMPLYWFQRLLHIPAVRRASLSRALQRMLGFRVMVVLKKKRM